MPVLLSAERRNTDRDLYELIKIIGDEIIRHTFEVPADGMLYHCVIGGDHESSVLQEQEETDCFESGYRRLRKTTVEIIDQHNQRNTHLLQDGLEVVPQCINLFGRRCVLLWTKEPSPLVFCFLDGLRRLVFVGCA